MRRGKKAWISCDFKKRKNASPWLTDLRLETGKPDRAALQTGTKKEKKKEDRVPVRGEGGRSKNIKRENQGVKPHRAKLGSWRNGEKLGSNIPETIESDTPSQLTTEALDQPFDFIADKC